MAGLLPPIIAVLASNISSFSAGMAQAKAEASGVADTSTKASAVSQKAFLGLGAAVIGVGVASVKMAADFQTQMARLYTAAGAPKQAVQDATSQVLQLGDAVGFSGTQMAEALYHPVSAGLDLKTSLEAVKYAAEEAQISGASLDDTTYSLSSVMKAFNLDASQAHDTMATLNAIVGEGDMRFQDFNVSVKNWAPTAAQMGISITSMGAALAYLTDRGNSAEEAATRVTMGLTMMATPSKQAGTLLEGLGVASSDVSAATDSMTQILKKTGITQNQLAADLAKPDGIYVALTHLKGALDQAGVSGTEADSVLSKIFGGGRSDKAIMSLLQNLGGLKDKFTDITNATGQFDQAWADTQKTFSFQLKQMGATAENVGIKIGMVLIPILQGVMSWFKQNQWAVDALAIAIGVGLAAAMLRFAQIATTKLLTAILAVITGLTNMGGAAKTAGEETEAAATQTEAAGAATEGWASKLGKSLPVIGLVITGASMLGDQISKMAGVGDHTGQSVNDLTNSLLDMATGGKNATDKMEGMAKQLALASKAMGEIGKGPVQGMQDFDTALAGLVTSGNADQAKRDFDLIAKAIESTGMSADDVAKLFPNYNKAVADAGTAARTAASASKDAGPAIEGLTGPLGDAAGAANGMADSLDSATQAYNTLTGNITASGALDAFKKDLLDTKDAIDKNGRSLGDNTTDGLANREAFRNAAKQILDYRDAQIKNGVATSDANQTASDQAQQLIDVWEKLGANKQQVEAYANQLGLIPKNLSTTVTLDTSTANRQLVALGNGIGHLTQASSPGGGGSRVKAYATGGWVDGPKGAPQLAVVHGGEFVMSDDMINGNGLPAGGSVGGFGGAVSAPAPAGGTVVINLNVAGSLLSTKADIKQAIQEVFLQNGMRNTQNGLTFVTN